MTATTDTDATTTPVDIAPPVSTRATAFHALGTTIPEGLSVREALEYAHMADWDVRTEPLTAIITDEKTGERKEVHVEGRNAVVRTNPFTGQPEALGVVGARWTPFQNEDAANLLTNIVDESGATLSTALVLNGGRKTGLVMKMPNSLTFTSPVTGEDDVTDMNLVIFNSHDGGGSLTGVVTPIRLYCANQQRMAETTARSRFSLRHTGNAMAKLHEIREMLGLQSVYQKAFADQCNAMIARELDEEHARLELVKLFGATDPDASERSRELRMNTVDTVFSLYMASPTVLPFRGTAYGVYNAVTEYTDHVMRVVVPDGRNEREMRALRTMESAGVDEFKARAFAQLVPAYA